MHAAREIRLPLLAGLSCSARDLQAQEIQADRWRMHARGEGAEAPWTVAASGIDFDSIRPWQEGDDSRHLDIRSTLRRGRLQARSYANSRIRSLHLCLDLGASMHFGSQRATKALAAAQLGAILGWLSIQEGGSFSLAILGQPQARGIPAGSGSHQMLRASRCIVKALEWLAGAEGAELPGDQLDRQLRAALHAPREGICTVISDFAWLDEGAAGFPRHSVAVRVRDLLEAHPPGDALPLAAQAPGAPQRWLRAAEADQRQALEAAAGGLSRLLRKRGCRTLELVLDETCAIHSSLLDRIYGE